MLNENLLNLDFTYIIEKSIFTAFITMPLIENEVYNHSYNFPNQLNLVFSLNKDINEFYYFIFFDNLLNLDNIFNFDLKYNYYFKLYNILLTTFIGDLDLIYYVLSSTTYDYYINKTYSLDVIQKTNIFHDFQYSNVSYNLIILNLIFIILMFISLSVLKNLNITRLNDLIFFKAVNYFNNFSKNYRINFQVTFLSFFFIFESLLFSIMQSNNSNIEFIEVLHLTIIYFVIFIILFLLYKYSLHYFSFLEQSVVDGENISFVTKQFVRDLSNTFALFLRFFLLLFRLNIYDGLDDFLDSYCIFFAEFSEMSEFNSDCDMYVFNNSYSFNLINDSGDLSIDDIDLLYFFDFLIIYYENTVESLNYWLFLLEEIFRLILAIYIIYLIILEVHTINLNYLEDNYINIKK